MKPDEKLRRLGIEHGQCIKHGYVITRCCVLFEPRKVKPFLRPAIEKAMSENKPGYMTCRACTMDDHRHRAHWVGPYLICRCLTCPVLVVRTR